MKVHFKIVYLIGFLLLSFVLMLVSGLEGGLPTQTIREKIYLPIERLQSARFHLQGWLTGLIINLQENRKLQEENRLLKRELAELEFREKNYYQEIIASNQRLKKMLGFKEEHTLQLLPVEVTAYPPRSFFKVVFISKGKREEMKKNMVVVNAEGLVGRIVEVYPHQSRVLTILDERSKVGVINQRTRDLAILRGKELEGVCELQYLLGKASIEIGDKVVTSGVGGLFPKGILVGTITHIRKNPHRLFLEVQVTPSVNFGRLEELFVIKE